MVLCHILSMAEELDSKKKVKLVTLVEGDPKASFSIATTSKCRGGCYSIDEHSRATLKC